MQEQDLRRAFYEDCGLAETEARRQAFTVRSAGLAERPAGDRRAPRAAGQGGPRRALLQVCPHRGPGSVTPCSVTTGVTCFGRRDKQAKA